MVTAGRLAALLGALQVILTASETSLFQDAILAKVEALEKEVRRIPLLEAEVVRLREEAAARRTAESSFLEVAVDHAWLLRCGAAIMLMQAGFAMLEAGTVRVKNVQHVMLKNLTDVCVGTIVWWAVGWTMAFGERDAGTRFAGAKQYFANGFLSATKDGQYSPLETDPQVRWVFHWAFCCAAATIVSGGVAERMTFLGYTVYTTCMTGFIYPIVAYWAWSGEGWLSGAHAVSDLGYYDFAGSGVVHMTGGLGALVGAVIVGPRKGRFEDEEDFVPHSLPLVVFGTLILWYGWYGFNAGSIGHLVVEDKARLAAHIAMNTTIAPAAGGLTVLMLRLALLRKYDLGGMCHGILAGLVSITAACANVHTYSSFAIAVVGGVLYQVASTLLRARRIDDPLDAFAIHGVCGAWGAVAAVLFDWGKGFNYFNGQSGFKCTETSSGDCYKDAWLSALSGQVVGLLAIASWVTLWSIAIFLPMRLLGILRASEEVEFRGLDTFKHSPATAYSIQPYRTSNAPVKAPPIVPTKLSPDKVPTLA